MYKNTTGRGMHRSAGVLDVRSAERREADARPEGRRLGIYAKTEASHEPRGLQVNHETGEIVGLTPDPRLARAERFALKSVVNRLLPTSRTSKCMRWRLPRAAVQIHKSVEHGKAFYSGLQVCASVWACPVCAAKISERRRVELATAIAQAKAKNLCVKLYTLTVPHGAGDDLRLLVKQLLSAWRRTTTGRAGKEFRKLFQIEGTIRAFEVTHGANGFHPHLHVLVFSKVHSDNATPERMFGALWRDACVKEGLREPSEAHGCRVDDGTYAAAYASKWGLESELTKANTKKGREGSMTPWDFLRAVFDKSEGWERCAHLFRTYAEAFKGQRQLYWSNGLRSLLEVSIEATDEEVAAAQEDNAHLLAELTDDQWRAVLATKSEALVLDVAEDRPEALFPLLETLQRRAREAASVPT